MQDGIDSAFEEAAADFDRSVSRWREAYGRLNELGHTARSKDGMVTVTVGSRGQVRSITFDPRVYRKLSPSELADAITSQLGAATGEMSARMRELVEPMMPDGLRYEDIFGAEASLDAFFPTPEKR
ncbi:YbaB/EbfC family nucleoid-associated protein [Nonomuraea sp. MG754425]|uniref:YbaB/EbfC family nucleoid-associated protein n=1 Tax=Nonomuraea sp. MG754425 TaxID=2570319 RepID=UPI001F34804B|nr:YbaB/EbfC family nucleoid-associated protein [Nonomuraea sp. MG754425]MCF6476292.1 YbaB/EbfC family nucleoid-associated protein [Nonomuraea sp. MG754425]